MADLRPLPPLGRVRDPPSVTSQRVTTFDAAHILGCSPGEAKALLARPRRLTLAKVEAFALEHYSWRRHTHDPESYWVTVSQAAELRGVSIQRVKQLLDKDFLPYSVHKTGTRLMRREQLETVANARLSRRLQEHQ